MMKKGFLLSLFALMFLFIVLTPQVSALGEEIDIDEDALYIDPFTIEAESNISVKLKKDTISWKKINGTKVFYPKFKDNSLYNGNGKLKDPLTEFHFIIDKTRANEYCTSSSFYRSCSWEEPDFSNFTAKNNITSTNITPIYLSDFEAFWEIFFSTDWRDFAHFQEFAKTPTSYRYSFYGIIDDLDPEINHMFDGSDSILFNNQTESVGSGARIIKPRGQSTHYNSTNASFNSLVFFNQSSTFWNLTLSMADANGSADLFNLCQGDVNCITYLPVDVSQGPDIMLDRKSTNNIIFPALTGNSTGISSNGTQFTAGTTGTNITNGANLDFGTGDFSISFWFQSDFTDGSIMSDRARGLGLGQPGWSITTIDTVCNDCGSFVIEDGSSILTISFPNLKLTDGAWHFITISNDRSGNSVIYLDDLVRSTDMTSVSGSLTNTRDIVLMDNNIGADISGRLDEITFWDKALTSNEVMDIRKASSSQHAETNITPTYRSSNNYNLSDVGLVSFWALNNNSLIGENGTTVVDLVGINNGTINGAKWADANGTVGGGFSFVASTADINMGTSTTLSPPNMTLCAWLRPDELVSTNEYAISKFGAASSGSYFMRVGTSERFNLLWVDSGNSIHQLLDPTVLEVARWYHICFVIESGNQILYNNAVNTVSDTVAGTVKSTAEIFRLGERTGQVNNWDGAIDEVRLYDRVLSPGEIQDLFLMNDNHIEWIGGQDNFTSLGKASDEVPLQTTNTTFVQFKYKFFTNDTAVSPYIFNQSIMSGLPPPVGNLPPTINSIKLNATSEFNLTEDNLTGFVTASDPEGKNITIDFNWYKTNSTDVNVTVATTMLEGPSLLGYWPFNNDTLDYARNNNGTLINNLDPTSPVANVSGKVLGGITGTGNSGFINVSYLDINLSHSNFSYSGWFKPADDSARSILWGYGNTNLAMKHFILSRETSGRLLFAFADGAFFNPTDIFPKQEWVHVVATYDFVVGEQKLYGNGELIGTQGSQTSNFDGIQSNLGWFAFSEEFFNNQHFNGTMDEVMIFNKTLSDVEVKQLFFGGLLEGHTLNSSVTSVGDNFTFGARAGDSQEFGIEVNSSSIEILGAADTTPPNVTNLLPLLSSVFNQSNNVTMLATVKDAIGVDTVSVTVTLPDGFTETLLLADIGGDLFLNPNFNSTSLLGLYNVTFFANDTSNNINNTEMTNFTVVEITAPLVFDLRPNISSVFNESNEIHISANVTDDFGVDAVIANILQPNGTYINISLSNLGGDQFNNTFIAPNLTGLYNVTFIANDSFNNINNTEMTNFTVNDITAPTIIETLTQNETQIISGGQNGTVNRGSNVTINATVIDSGGPGAVDSVWVIVWDGLVGGPQLLLEYLTNIVGDLWSIQIETNVTYPLGDVNYTIFANDTSDNEDNLSSTFEMVRGRINVSIENAEFTFDEISFNSPTYVVVSNITFNLSTVDILTVKGGGQISKLLGNSLSLISQRITINGIVLSDEIIASLSEMDAITVFTTSINQTDGLIGQNNLVLEYKTTADAINISNFVLEIDTNNTGDVDAPTTLQSLTNSLNALSVNLSSTTFTSLGNFSILKIFNSTTVIDLQHRITKDGNSNASLSCFLENMDNAERSLTYVSDLPGMEILSTSTQAADCSTCTHSHTVQEGADKILIVGISLEDSDVSKSVSTVTYDGNTLTRIGQVAVDKRADAWYLLNPPEGTADVVVTIAGGNSNKVAIGSMSVKGVNQGNPISGFTSATGDGGTPTLVVDSSPNGDIVMDVIATGDATITAGAGQTERWNLDMGASGKNGGASTEVGSGSVSMSWAVDDKWAHIAFNINRSVNIENTGVSYRSAIPTIGSETWELFCKSTNLDLINNNITNYMIDMRDTEGNDIQGFYNQTLGVQSITGTSNKILQVDNYVVRNGTEVFTIVNINAQSTTGRQDGVNSPRFRLNRTVGGVSCETNLQRSFAESNQIGTIKFYNPCNNLTTGDVINVSVWVDVAVGETIEIINASMSSYETNQLDVVSGNVPPEVVILSPLEGEIISGIIQIIASVIDLNGNRFLQNVSISNGTDNIFILQDFSDTISNVTLDTSLFADGLWNITWSVLENDTIPSLGANDTVEVLIDNTAPIVNIVIPVDGSTIIANSFDLNYTLFELGVLDTCWYNIDNGVNITVVCGQNVTGLTESDGAHTVTVFANDSNGLLGSDTNSFNIMGISGAPLQLFPLEETYNTLEPINITGECLYQNGTLCGPQVACGVTSWYPNETIFFQDDNMTFQKEGVFNYQRNASTTIGGYSSSMSCFNNGPNFAPFTFDIIEPMSSGSISYSKVLQIWRNVTNQKDVAFIDVDGNLDLSGNLNITGCICYNNGLTCLGTCV